MRKIKTLLLRAGIAMMLAVSSLGSTFVASAETAVIAPGSEKYPNEWRPYEEKRDTADASKTMAVYKSYKYRCYRVYERDGKESNIYTDLKDCWAKIGGKWYYFTSVGYYSGTCGGRMCKIEYIDGYWLNANGSWTYKHKASWKHSKQGWWYGDDTKWYAKSQWLRIDNKFYYFNAKGYAVTGWQKIGGQWYYFNTDCSLKADHNFTKMTDPVTGKERTLYFFGDGTWK